MNVIVAGGSGFLGTHLCLKLLKQGHFVIILDSFVTGQRKNIKFLQENCLHKHQLKIIDIDITNAVLTLKEWQNALLESKIDQIYHLASVASPPQYDKFWNTTIKANTIGLFNLIEIAKRYKAKLLYVSSSEVYGCPTVHPQTEEYYGNVNPFGPRSLYDEAKRMGEAICHEYIFKEQMDIKISRTFNTFGPMMNIDDGRVITEFIKAILSDKPLPIFGDGTTTRSFCYVDDQIDGLMMLMNSVYKEPINIGNPHEISLNELANQFDEIVGHKIPRINLIRPKDDPKQRKPDISKMNLIGWNPKISLKEGLQKTLEFFLCENTTNGINKI